MGYVLFIYQDLPVTHRHQTHDHVETGCFSSSVGPQQADNFARLNLHGDAANDFALAESLVKVNGFEH